MMTKIAVIAGSTREGSYHRALGELAAASLEAQGASVTRVDLAAFALPLYPAALAASAFTPDALKPKTMFDAPAGPLVSSTDYTGFLPPHLNNVITLASPP